MDLATLWIAVLAFSPLFPSVSSCSDYDALWKVYQVTYDKKYTVPEAAARRILWEQNAARIARHNLEADLGLHSYRMELNKFADKTTDELDVYRKCLKNGNASRGVKLRTIRVCDKKCASALPPFVDWRTKGFVTPVKDQGDCGSCWAFSSTGALEGQHKAKTGVLVNLSEQNLVDCSWIQGNQGCNGGWMDYAFQYVIDNRGIDVESVYKYKGRDGHCKFQRSGVGANCTGYSRIKSKSEIDLQATVAQFGPVSVAIDAEDDDFMFYKSGIYSSRTCSSVLLDHAVLVVGYGSRNGTDYWIVKNSWGSDWGMAGYILMTRNAGNQCGIATHALIPSV